MNNDQIYRARVRMESLQEEVNKIDLLSAINQAELVISDLGRALNAIEILNQRLDEHEKVEGHLMSKIESQVGELEKVDKKLSEALEKIASLDLNESTTSAEKGV